MKTEKHLNVGLRIGLAFGLCIVLLVVVAATGLSSLRSVNQALHSITDEYYAKVKLIGQIESEINKQAGYARNVLLFEQAEPRLAELDAISASAAAVAKSYARLLPLMVAEEDIQTLSRVQRVRIDYQQSTERFEALARSGQLLKARTELVEHLRQAQLRYHGAVTELHQQQERAMDQAAVSAEAELAHSGHVLKAVAACAVLLTVSAAWLIAHSVLRRVDNAVRVAEAVATGNLTVHEFRDSEHLREFNRLVAAPAPVPPPAARAPRPATPARMPEAVA